MKDVICNLLNRRRCLRDILNCYDYISFDIFDTLIVRKCGQPDAIFQIVEDRFNGQHNMQLHGYHDNRVLAEKSARRLTKKKEVTLDEIYRLMAKLYGCETADELKKLEIETEIDECVGRTDILNIYNDIGKDKHVLITSDMYLSTDVILEILNKNHIRLPKRLFLSSACDATKRDGALFDLIMEDQKCQPHMLLHIGDSFRSDFVMPMLKGVHPYIISKNR